MIDGEKFSIAEMIFHHTGDAHELDFGRDRILEKRDAARHLSERNAGNTG